MLPRLGGLDPTGDRAIGRDMTEGALGTVLLVRMLIPVPCLASPDPESQDQHQTGQSGGVAPRRAAAGV